MKKLVSIVLFGTFCVALVYFFGIRIFDWWQTGQLAIHRKMIHGPDFVSYDSDAVLFAWEIGGCVVFVVMGLLGLGVVVKEIRE